MDEWVEKMGNARFCLNNTAKKKKRFFLFRKKRKKRTNRNPPRSVEIDIRSAVSSRHQIGL